MIVPRVKSERKLGFAHELPEMISVYCCDSPSEKAFEVLKCFLPTVIFVQVTKKIDAHFILECRPSVTKNDEQYFIDAAQLPIKAQYRAFIGARNAVASIAQLLTKRAGGYTFEAVMIEDEPDNAIRSILFDVARCIIPVNVMKDRLIRLALTKYNLVHLHLVDSRGLAFRSDKYPQIAGPHGMQYTKTELRELIAFGESLGLEFMPEVEFPGHATQIVKDLPETACKTITGEPSTWAMCAGSEATYEYLKNIYTEVAELFPNSRFFHVGTDEIAMYDLVEQRIWPTWDDCAVCKAMCAREGIDNHNVVEIFYYMLRRVYRIVSELGKRMVMWNDYIDIAKSPDLPRDILILFWRVAGENRGPREGCSMQRFLEEGFECLNSYYSETYIEREFYSNTDDHILKWTPKTAPIGNASRADVGPITDPVLASQILGGGPCAWGEKMELEHYAWSLPSSTFLYGDRLWNECICTDLDAFGAAATRWALGVETPAGFNIYKQFGGFMQPRSIDGTRMWVDKAAADLTETEAVLRSLAKKHTYCGRLADVYVKSVEWLREKRGE